MSMNARKTKYGALAAALAATIAVGALIADVGGEDIAPKLPTERVRIEIANGKTHDFDLEMALSPVDQKIGLMYRKAIAKNGGMLFWMGPPPRPVSFWMKNTYVPLDMIFVAEDGKILHIHPQATPLSLDPVSSMHPVVAVIELKGGRAEDLGIVPGARVSHRLFD